MLIYATWSELYAGSIHNDINLKVHLHFPTSPSKFAAISTSWDLFRPFCLDVPSPPKAQCSKLLL